MIDILNKKILITGASGALGTQIAYTLSDLGAKLILVDLSIDKLNIISDLISSKHSNKVHSIECDLENEKERFDLLKKYNSIYSSLDCLINNAAFVGTSKISGWSVDFLDQSLETWRRALEVNLTAPFHLSQLFSPLLRKSDSANIINIASIYGHLGPDWSLYEGTSLSNPAAYGASKGGLVQLTKWLSTTLAPDIRVNAISPGGIFRKQPDKFVSKYIERTPLGRMATEKDIANSVAFFSSNMSSYVTGQTLMVDGGWSAW